MSRRIVRPALAMLLLAGCALRTPPAEPPTPAPEPAQAREPGPEELVQLAEAYFAEAMTELEEGREEEADQAMEAALATLIQGQGRYPTHQELQQTYCWIVNEASLAAQPIPEELLPKEELPDLTELPEELEPMAPEVEILGEVPREMNRQVANCIKYFTARKKGVIQRALSRGSAYMPMIRQVCRAKGVPVEIGYLPVIESAFNPKARSYARANGMWQFISSTGRAYGLETDWWCDDRLDPVQSTDAALEHLKDLYERFESWHLALAAYNAGERRVSRAVKRAGTDDFWVISKKRLLPKQTRNYVPAFIAAVIIADDPAKYGLEVEPQPVLEFDEVTLTDQTEFRVAARCAGTDTATLEALNPDIRRGVTPPRASYSLKIPKGARERFEAEYAKVPRTERAVWKRHVVRQGDSLWKLARRYGTTESAIRRANHMGSHSMIRVGRSLLIPSVIDHGSGSGRRADCPPPSRVSSPPTGERTSYQIRRGDTLGSIARRFGVSVEDLRRWNGLRGNRIVAGKSLSVYGSTPSGRQGSSPIPADSRKYTVRRGDSLWTIARAHGATVEQLRHWNGLGRSSRIHPGARLLVGPGNGGTPADSPATTSGRTEGIGSYLVRQGDSLWTISQGHGVTVDELRRWNGLGRRAVLQPGQRLVVHPPNMGTKAATPATDDPPSSQPATGPARYTVRRGDSLWTIAQAQGVTVEDLRRWNDLGRSSRLHPGDVLIVGEP